MLKAKFKLQGDEVSPVLEFSTPNMSFVINSDSVLDYPSSKWEELAATDNLCTLLFGDEYGSHVDNGKIEITATKDKVIFEIDGARGGVMTFHMEKSRCVSAFREVAKLLKSMNI